MDFKTGLVLVCFICATVSVGNVYGADPPAICRTIDAGIRWFGTLYLFSEDEYMEIDVNNTEVNVSSVLDWGDEMPTDIDAAVQWTGNYRYYFFKHSQYWSYGIGGLGGPWNAGYWWHSFFEGGIDAAGNRQGVSHFFKGCTYRTWESYYQGISNSQPIGGSGIPCDLDAAWDLENNWDELVLAKGRQIWIWGEEVTGPFEFSSIYNITSWTLC